VIVGAEHVSFSAALTLAHAGVRVVAMVTDLPRQQSYAAFHAAAVLRWAFPVLTGATVTRLLGRPRLAGVEVRAADGREGVLAADTVVFTGDWIPDHELARRGGLDLDAGTRGPAVDAGLRTSAEGVFAVGNLVHPVETADVVALEAAAAAEPVLEYLAGRSPWPRPGVPVTVQPPLAWVAPNRIDGARSLARPRFAVWPRAFAAGPVALEVRQGDRLLHRERRLRGLVPNRPARLDGGWTADVDPSAGPVTVTAR
jgi:pyruvate/2-oxoglutarate dehydrogenase complex dihydrolipoamide dehydrogenase (E3) component